MLIGVSVFCCVVSLCRVCLSVWVSCSIGMVSFMLSCCGLILVSCVVMLICFFSLVRVMVWCVFGVRFVMVSLCR